MSRKRRKTFSAHLPPEHRYVETPEPEQPAEEPMSVEQPTAPVMPGLSPEQFAQLIAVFQQNAGGGLSKDDLASVIQGAQKAAFKAQRPENDTHPGKSHMSYPEGDVAKPRPAIPWPILLWNGYPQHKFPEELWWPEAELMCQLEPGVYDCSMKDGKTSQKVEVLATKDGNGAIEKMEVRFAVTRETKEQIPPLYVRLYQLVHGRKHKSLMESFMVGMTNYLRLQVEDEQAKRAS